MAWKKRYYENNYAGRRDNFRTYRRKTGAQKGKYVVKETGELKEYVRGWRPDPYTKSGFQSVLCVPRNDEKLEPKNKESAKKYQNWVAIITDSRGKTLTNAIYNIAKGFCTLPDYGLIVSPNGRGYFGRISKR